MEKFLIVKDTVKTVKRFNLQGRVMEFKIKPIPTNEEPVSWVRDAINQVIERCTEGLNSQDQVAFSFCSKDFQRGEGWVRFRPLKDTTFQHVWDIISSIYQSNSTGLNTENFCLGVTSVRMPAGQGRQKCYNTFEEECIARKGILVINNKDNLCLPRALVVAIAHVSKDTAYTKIRRDIGKLQTERAQELIRDACVTIPEEGCGIPELQQFQQYLNNYKIVVYSYGNKGRDVIFSGLSNGPSLNLLYHDGHYNVITSLTAAFCCIYYCETCHVPYDHKDKHRCQNSCPCCQESPACPQEVNIMCTDCGRKFRGQPCFDNHKKERSHGKGTVCSKVRRCENCFKIVKTERQHTCGEIFCKICKKHVEHGHMCYIQPDTGSPKIKDILFVFYDLETRQEKRLDDGSLLHEPNLCVFKQCCDTCLNEVNLYFCQKCGFRQKVFKENVISHMLNHILSARKKFKQVVVIGHNAGGFDHQFILNHVLTKTDLTPELIMRGTKLILMELDNVKFLDSLNYFPMALSKLPKAFGLTELKKGYFPHLFNTIDNQNYVGPIPSIEFYSPDTMKTEDREKFLYWHAERISENYVFDFQKEILEYCVSDVDILTGACLKFRQQMLDTTNVCPFTEATTIASACNKVYRRNFLKPNTIGIIPKNGYRYKNNQSQIAIQWLIWEEHQRNVNIIHTAKEEEAIVAGVKVDGFCKETNQVFEFQGCYYHGCPKCYQYCRSSPLLDSPHETLDTRYESTTAKVEHLQSKGYAVIQMWECNFRRKLNDENEISLFTESHPLVAFAPLNPRDAFYGGRTGNVVGYYKVAAEEKIKYVDVCSLYPYVCKYGAFPVGHPKIYVGAEECSALSLSTITGLIKCTILPPTKLFHPVLPQKMNNKLMFVLCRTCGESMQKEECNHTNDERALTGSWVINEVVKAVEMGYKIQQIHEIWSFDVQQFDKITGTQGLFTSMMNKFIKIKQEASGWPKNCHTPEERERYIEEFLNREDIRLEFAAICENPGLRCLAKLMLNSFWGKFGQRENQPKTKIVNEPGELFNMLSNPAYIVNTILPINDTTLIVTYHMTEDSFTELSTVNVVIASYVTALARLKLYSYLEKINERVLYYDTDSVIYVSRPGEDDIPTGEFIGDLTDELESYGSGSYITEFVSGGPKNYAYKVISGRDNQERVVCKVKGISLNYAASQLVNFNTIKDMILNQTDPIYITSKNIRRTKEHEVVTRDEKKIYRPNSTKRKFCSDDQTSVPYGYKKLKP